jgi:hypothetical protein
MQEQDTTDYWVERDAPSIRRRVSVDTTSKGIQSASATFEASGLTEAEFAKQSLTFFEWVNKIWPPPITLNV